MPWDGINMLVPISGMFAYIAYLLKGFYVGECTLVPWIIWVILLMEEILNHLGCIKSCNKLPTSTGAGFQPSTVFSWQYINGII